MPRSSGYNPNVPDTLDYESLHRDENTDELHRGSPAGLVALLVAILLLCVTWTRRHPDEHTLILWLNIVGVALLFGMTFFTMPFRERALVFIAILVGLLSLLASTVVLGRV